MINRLHRETYDALEWGGARQGAFGFSQSEQHSESLPVDSQAPEFAALRGPIAEVLLGLVGRQDPVQGRRRIPGQPDEVTTLTPGPGGNAALTGLPQFGGQYTAPIGTKEQALLQALMGQTGGASGRGDYLSQVLSGQYLTPDANPFLQQFADAANRQTMQQYEHLLDRVLPGQFTRAGQNVNPGQSSAFDTAAAIESRGLADALADTNAKIFGQAYEAERGRQQEAVQLSQQEVDTTIKNLQAQALPRLIEQHGLDQGLAEFQRQTTMLIQVLSVLQGLTPPSVGQHSQGSGSSIGIHTSGGVGFGSE